MGECTNCAGKSGCDDRKGTMFAELDRALAALYPTKCWGEPVASAVAGPPALELIEALAEELRQELDAHVFVHCAPRTHAWRPHTGRSLASADYCDYLYIQCMGRPPSLAQACLTGGDLVAWQDGAVFEELYVRVALSHLWPFAAAQQAHWHAERSAPGAGLWVQEATRAGVYDAPLLPRMQRLVAILPSYGWTHLDFGEISAPPADFSPGTWQELFAGAPATANYLFFAHPTTMVSEQWLETTEAA